MKRQSFGARLATRLRLRLRHKLGISLVIAALLPVVVASWVAVSVVLRSLDSGVHDQTSRQLHVGLNLLLRNVERLGQESVRLAGSQRLVEALGDGPVSVADALAREAPHLSSSLVQVADRDGIIQGQRVIGGVVARFEGLGVSSTSDAIRIGMTYERRVNFRKVGGELVIRAVAPVVDQSFKLRGVVVVSVPLDGVFADELKAALGTDVLLFPGPARTLADSTFLDELGARQENIRLPVLVAERVFDGRNAFHAQPIGGRQYAIGYAPIMDLEGQVVGVFGVAVDRAPIISAEKTATRSLALGAAGAFVFALGLAGLLSRRITQPLQRLHQGAVAIARGELDHRIRVPPGDEIGDLATAFTDMTSALEENQRRLAARMREIVALHDAGRAVSSVIELDQVLRKVVDSVARVLHVRVCALWLVKEGARSTGPVLELGAGRAKRPDMRTIVGEEEIQSLVAPLEAMVREVAVARGSLRIDSIADDPRHREAARAAGITSSLVATTLERKGSVVGVVLIGRGDNARPFSEADAHLLATFADQAATAIENASLYAEVRAFNEELEAKVELRTTELTAINAELGRTITELRETQAQLILSERLAGLGQLVAGVAHEINSPSAAIRGTADALADNVRRMASLSQRVVDVGWDPSTRDELWACVSELAPELAARRRPAPALARRDGRELEAALVRGGVDEQAAEVARSLAELGVDDETGGRLWRFLGEIAPAGGERAGEGARLVADALAEHVYLHRAVRTIQDAIRRIQRIVGSLKSYSHLDQEATRTEADLREGIENTITILDHLLARGITLTRAYGDIPAIPVFVDELNQVWTNLLHNAVQALEGEGTIAIETALADEGVVVRVIDDGAGIPAEVMPRIFEPFFTTKPKGEGTGLGLGIVQQIVDKHGGRVHCESQPGRTCFEIWLPADTGAWSEPSREAPTESGGGAEA